MLYCPKQREGELLYESAAGESMVCCLLKGELIPLSQVEDEAFSNGMMGKGMAVRPEDGDTVKTGDLLMEFDREAIENSGYNMVTPVLVTNTDDFWEIIDGPSGRVQAGDKMMTLVK